MFHKIKILVIVVGAIFSMLVGIAPSVHATTYGVSGYGECYYAKDCPAASTPASPTPVPTTPQQPSKPAASSPTITVGLNLTAGQVITQKNQAIIATFYQSQNGDQTVLPATEIGWTAFYVENSLIGTIYNSTDDKTFQITWRPQKSGDQTVSIVGYNHNGTALARTDVSVSVEKSAVTDSPATTNNTGTTTDTVPRNNQKAAKNSQNTTSYFSTKFERVGLPRTLGELPMFMLRTYPLWLFIILLILSIRYWWISVREAAFIRNIERSINHERLVSDEIVNYVILISRYLHKPLNLLRSSTNVLGTISDQERITLQQVIDDMKSRVDYVISMATRSKNMSTSSISPKPVSSFDLFTSRAFWAPVFLVLIVTVGANLVLFMTDNASFAIGNMWFRVFVLAAAIAFLGVTLRLSRFREQDHTHALERLATTQNNSRVQAETIRQSSKELNESVARLNATSQRITNPKMVKYLDQGLGQIENDIYKLELSLLTAIFASSSTYANVPMHQVFTQAFEARQTSISSRGLRIENQIHNLTVQCEPKLLSCIADELVDNAIKYTIPGGSIIVREINNGLIVEDNGVGMSPQVVASLFVPFSQTIAPESAPLDDIGFGLALSKIIAERMGGSLVVNSVEGRGTKVTVLFS